MAEPVVADPDRTPTDGWSRTARRPAPAGRRATASEPTLGGDLSQAPLVDILQALVGMRRDGTLVIEREEPQQSASIGLRAGRVVDAYCPPLSGEACVHAVAGWSSGRFLFLAGAKPERETIAIDAHILLIETTRRVDELARVRARLPPPDAPLHRERDAERLHAVRLSTREWRILELVDGRRTVRGVLDAFPRDPIEAGHVLLALIDAGAVTLDDRCDWLGQIVLRRLGDAPLPASDQLTMRTWLGCDGAASLSALLSNLGCTAHDLIETVRRLLLAQRLEPVAGVDELARFVE